MIERCIVCWQGIGENFKMRPAMSTPRSNYPIAGLNSAIAATLRWLATWLETPPARRADKGGVLPKDLANAEDWLLADLGLKKTDDGAPRRALAGKSRQR